MEHTSIYVSFKDWFPNLTTTIQGKIKIVNASTVNIQNNLTNKTYNISTTCADFEALEQPLLLDGNNSSIEFENDSSDITLTFNKELMLYTEMFGNLNYEVTWESINCTFITIPSIAKTINFKNKGNSTSLGVSQIKISPSTNPYIKIRLKALQSKFELYCRSKNNNVNSALISIEFQYTVIDNNSPYNLTLSGSNPKVSEWVLMSEYTIESNRMLKSVSAFNKIIIEGLTATINAPAITNLTLNPGTYNNMSIAFNQTYTTVKTNIYRFFIEFG